MPDVSLDEALRATTYVLADQRGYDGDSGWLHPATWKRAAGNPEAATQAILAAVADTAGFFAVADLDMTDERDRRRLTDVAVLLEEAAAALRGDSSEPDLSEQ